MRLSLLLEPGSGLDGKDVLIGEVFTGEISIAQFRVQFLYLITNRVKKVRFADPAAAVHEQRVEL